MTDILWSAAEAVAATGGTCPVDFAAKGVSIDTRTIAPGDLFVALTAARDGHDFVAQALEKGAAAALVSHIPDGVPAGAPLVLVDDVQAGLEALGRAARARMAGQVIAITGSVGKTSTKEMLRAALAGQGKVHAAEKSYNNHWGVPLTLARMPADSDFAVIEIGMNHPGEIAPLSRLAAPHVALITTVAPAHLEAFDDGLPGIAREKASIIAGLQTGGVAVLPLGLDVSDILLDAADAAGVTVRTFGRTAADWQIDDVSTAGDRTLVRARHGETIHLVNLATLGQHFASNAVGALAAASAAGADPVRSALGLADWLPPAGRGRAEWIALTPDVPDVGITLFDDAYNANPTSMAASLDVLGLLPAKAGPARRRVAILGDMLELGGGESVLHAAIADLPGLAQIDTVHCVGPRMAVLHAALPPEKRGQAFDHADAAKADIGQLVVPGDVVLIKGSLGSGVIRLVDALRKLGQANAAS